MPNTWPPADALAGPDFVPDSTTDSSLLQAQSGLPANLDPLGGQMTPMPGMDMGQGEGQDEGGALTITQVAEGTVDLTQPHSQADSLNLVNKLAQDNTLSYNSYYSLDGMDKKSGPDILAEIGSMCRMEYMWDVSSRQEWEARAIDDYKYFACYMDEKSWPWPNCSNVNMPLIAMACLQFQSRAREALIKKEIVAALPTGPEDQGVADRIEKYMNYQLHWEIHNFEEGMDKLLMQIGNIGMSFKKVWYDPTTNQVRADYCSALSVVVDNNIQDLREAPRISHRFFKTMNDIRVRALRGEYYYDIAWDMGFSPYAVDNTEYEQHIASVMGAERRNDPRGPRLIIEQHRLLDLDGDGIQEPYVVTFDYQTAKVLSIVSRSVTLPDGSQKVINHFIGYGCIPNSEGFYEFGIGSLGRGLNKSANDLLNETIDAGALANIQGGFVSKRSGLRKGDLTFQMGQWKEVDAYTDDIQKAIYTFDFKGPNASLHTTLGLIIEQFKVVMSVSEVTTGAMPPSDTPAHTILALIEQGRQLFGSIYSRIHRSFTKELQTIGLLNSIYMDENVYFHVLGEDGRPSAQGETVGRADFTRIYDVVPVSDPALMSKAERVLLARDVRDDVFSNPLTKDNQNALYAAQHDYYKALGVHNIDILLAPPTPPQGQNPVDENALIIKGGIPNVTPQDDDMAHLQVHEGFMASPYATLLDPTSVATLQAHILAHHAQQYQKAMQARQGQPQQLPGGNR